MVLSLLLFFPPSLNHIEITDVFWRTKETMQYNSGNEKYRFSISRGKKHTNDMKIL